MERKTGNERADTDRGQRSRSPVAFARPVAGSLRGRGGQPKPVTVDVQGQRGPPARGQAGGWTRQGIGGVPRTGADLSLWGRGSCQPRDEHTERRHRQPASEEEGRGLHLSSHRGSDDSRSDEVPTQGVEHRCTIRNAVTIGPWGERRKRSVHFP